MPSLDPHTKLVASNFTRYKPEPADEKLIRDAMAFLVIKSPFFAHLLYNECRMSYTKDIPIAATDGLNIMFNIDTVKLLQLTIQEIAFIIAHEVAHCFFGDLLLSAMWRTSGLVTCRNGVLPYDPVIMNEARDYRINGMLVESKIGAMPKDKKTGKQIGLFDTSISAKGMESQIDIYEKIYQQKQSQGGATGPGGFDVHLEPSKEQVKAEEAGQRAQAITAAVQAAEAAGTGTIPAAVRRMLGDILDPKVPWQDHLRSTMTRAAGDPAYDWRTIDRRLLVRPTPIYFAKMAHSGAGCIVVGVDTSGSIDQYTLDRFFGEMTGIVQDLNPAQLIVIWCDAAVGRVDELDDPQDLEELKMLVDDEGVNGGGGTDFRPVFDKIDELDIQPDMVVYLTDAYGTFPDKEPDYATVWGVIGSGGSRVPWGTVVEVEL